MALIHQYIQSSRITINMRKIAQSNLNVRAVSTSTSTSVNTDTDTTTTTTGNNKTQQPLAKVAKWKNHIRLHVCNMSTSSTCLQTHALCLQACATCVARSVGIVDVTLNINQYTAALLAAGSACRHCRTPHVENNVIYLHLQNAYAGPSMGTS